MPLSDQVNTIERALGERMLRHAFSILSQWVQELGVTEYQDRMQTLLDSYDHVFEYYLSADDVDRDQLLDHLTGQAYRLVDEVYADIRLRRGLSPQVVGFNPDNVHSVMQYFNSCVHLQEEDLRWLAELVRDSERRTMAVLTINSLGTNLRECFSEQAMMALIDAMSSEVELVAEQATSTVLLLLAHYDVRVDFFPEIQDAFMVAIDDGHVAFETMLVQIGLAKPTTGKSQMDITAETINRMFQAMQQAEEEDNKDLYLELLPSSEREYIAGIVAILPDTWVFSVLVGDNEERENRVEEKYLEIGRLEPMLDRLPQAERWLVEKLRSGKANALDYLNYGHCCFLRGDRMMAFESYVQSRQMCDSLKSFYHIFRPDRRFLVDRGIPIEQVYMMEDQIIRNEN